MGEALKLTLSVAKRNKAVGRGRKDQKGEEAKGEMRWGRERWDRWK